LTVVNKDKNFAIRTKSYVFFKREFGKKKFTADKSLRPSAYGKFVLSLAHSTQHSENSRLNRPKL